MNNICAIPKLKSHHFVPKGIYITVYNNTVKQFKYFFKAPRFRHALRQALTPSHRAFSRAAPRLWNSLPANIFRLFIPI